MIEKTSILLADDNNAVRKLMAGFLKSSGYLVTEAETGNEALKYFRKMRPDLIITDLRMPEMDGLEFIKIVTKESQFTPFIIISGEGDMQDAIVACDVLLGFLTTGTWGPPKTARFVPRGMAAGSPGVAVYLAEKEMEIDALRGSFPPVWEQIRGPEFSRPLAALVADL